MYVVLDNFVRKYLVCLILMLNASRSVSKCIYEYIFKSKCLFPSACLYFMFVGYVLWTVIIV